MDKRILEYLKNPPKKNIHDYSLYSGDAGMTIVYYLYARHLKDEKYSMKGLSLLDIISDNLNGLKETNFSNGLSGIGWSIEWLVQNNLLTDTNTDDVLADLDDIIYKQVMYCKDRFISLAEGTLGKIYYFHKRLLSKNPHINRFRLIAHEECLITLTDDINEYLKGEKGILNNKDRLINRQNENIFNIPYLLFVFSNISKINGGVLENIFYDLIDITDKIIIDFIENSPKYLSENNIKYQMDVIYLSVNYFIVSKQKNYYFAQRSLEFVQQILELYKPLFLDVENGISNKLVLLGLLQIYYPNVFCEKALNKALSKIDYSSLPNTLFHGIGTLAVIMLGVENPTLISNWHEILFFN